MIGIRIQEKSTEEQCKALKGTIKARQAEVKLEMKSELTTKIERLMQTAFPMYLTEVRNTSTKYFSDAIKNEETQQDAKLIKIKDFKAAFLYIIKSEATYSALKSTKIVKTVSFNPWYSEKPNKSLA
ncbi:hypothetical protein NPIL_624591 [Nephila pilipes]|uniref:Uncharacterized protein n=1 Tax=Nephila pilipes TaxID=299642 RepID=A0A8X6N9L0_NEPPI|nr:hypothetical protein NPIL_624591 [Nephila pilipes]